MNIKIVSILLTLIFGTLWYIYTDQDAKPNRGGSTRRQ